jgi:GT2 family glycosyltransferase
MERILLGQLGANGDCLYATILARQLRHDHPDAHITWAISSQCIDVVRNNPHIDDIWVVPIRGWDDHAVMWRVFEREALRRCRLRQFDFALFSQIWPNNFQNYDGTVRPSILRSYGAPITVPIENVINLSDLEVERVEDFAARESIGEFQHRILFECSSKSGQSFVTPELAQEVAEHVYAMLPDSTVIFNTHLPMELRNARSRYCGSLSLRESSWLTRHCSLFVGCGSGGTVAASSTSASKLPMIQLLSASTSVFASFAHDFEYFGIEDRDIFEITNEKPDVIAQAIVAACLRGMYNAEAEFGEPIPVKFDHYFGQLAGLLTAFRFLDAAQSVQSTAHRYGWTNELIKFAENQILPNLRLDPGWFFTENRRAAESFRAEVADAAGRPRPSPRQPAGGYRELGRVRFDQRIALSATVASPGVATAATVTFPTPASLREAIRICREEIALVEHELLTKEIPLPKSIANLTESRLDEVTLAANIPAAPDLRPASADSEVGDVIRIKPAGIWSGLARALREDRPARRLHILAAGDAKECAGMDAALGVAGCEVELVERGYGSDVAPLATGLLIRPVPSSLFGVLTHRVGLNSAFDGIALVGDAAFEAEVSACRDAGITCPIYLVSPGRGEIRRLQARPEAEGPPPLISIVTPSYNQAQFIERTIRSVLDQGYPNLEYVIVDGGSTDGSIEIIRRYDTHLHAFVCEADRGQSDAINKGFGLTSGELMNWLCSDDLLAPGSLDQLSATYRRHRPDLIVGGCSRIGERDEDVLFHHHAALELGKTLALDPLDLLKFTRSWQNGNYFFQPEVFFSRRIWELSGAHIKEHLFYAMDIDLWLRMALAGASVRHIPARLASSRVHAAQKTRSDNEWIHQIPILLNSHRHVFESMNQMLTHSFGA